MAVTISQYNHNRQRFMSGENAVSDSYKVALYTAATFDPTHATLAAVGGTEASGNGYVTGGASLVNVAVTIANTSDAKFDADDISWTATGGPITASFAVIYNDTDANDPPLAFIDFDGVQSAGDGTEFKIVWNASGIFVAS
jgi:hypothetical protein